MKPLIVFGLLWCGADTADVATDHYAVTHVHAIELNPILSQAPAARYTAVYASAVAGAGLSAYLWTHRHKRAAVAVTVLDVVARGFVARHNWIEGHRF